MLPSFRLIVATFCCGFLMVFAGLRLATSFNSVNYALPAMAAHAAPVRLAALTSQDQRNGAITLPVTYDMRFAVSVTQPATTPAAAIAERSAPLLMPLVILPPIAQETPAETTEQTETTTVAALPSQPAPEQTPPPAAFDIPLPEPATVDLRFSPPPAKAKEKPAVAAVAPAPLPALPSTSFDIPLPEPAAVDLRFSPSPDNAPAAAKPEAEIGPKSEAAPEQKPETDARSGSLYEHDVQPIEVAALPEEISPGTVKLPTRHIPLPRPKAPERIAALTPPAVHHAARTAAAKAKPRRRTVVAKRDDFEDFFNALGDGKRR